MQTAAPLLTPPLLAGPAFAAALAGARPVSLTFVLLAGTGVVVALLVFLFLMVVLSQRRMIKYQVALRTLQAARQQELVMAVFEAQESERQRLAADLHDSVGQVLSVIKLNLHRLQKLAAPAPGAAQLLTETSRLADDCISETRHIIRDILPPLLVDYGLASALHHLAGQLAQATGLAIRFTDEVGDTRFARELEVTLYRVAQELFSNAFRHAQATTLDLSLVQAGSELVLLFSDDGIGFEPAQVTPGLGLKNLMSRVALLGGHLHTESGPAGGTRTQVRVSATWSMPTG